MDFNKKPATKTEGKAERIAIVTALYKAGLRYAHLNEMDAVDEVSKGVYDELGYRYCSYYVGETFIFCHKLRVDNVMTNSTSHFIMSCRKRLLANN